jgi:hypothetical protein
MLTRRLFLLSAAISAACAAAGTAGSGAALADDAAALAFVKAIYDTYTKPHSDGVSIDSGKKLRRYFEPSLAAAMDKDQREAHGEVGKLDGDPFIDAQDWEFKTYDVVMKDTGPDKVTATVTFKNLGEATTIVLDLVKIKNDWRIYDITWQRDSTQENEPKTLRELFGLKQAA